jgi:hypothetical protein
MADAWPTVVCRAARGDGPAQIMGGYDRTMDTAGGASVASVSGCSTR